MPARDLNNSAAPRLEVLPLANAIGFSLALATAMNSLTVFAGKSGFTVSIIGIVMMPATAAKSAFGSYGIELNRLTFAAWVELVVTNTV